MGKALELGPDYPDAYLFRGVYLERLKKEEEARQCYARAAELFGRQAKENPSPEAATHHAIAVYLGTGKVGGLSELNTIIKKYPSYQPAQYLRDKVLRDERNFFADWVAGQSKR